MDALNHAIGTYQNWQSPFRFHDEVADSLMLERDRQRFEQAWSEANDASHWTSADLVACTRSVEKALIEKFPDLSPASVSAIAKAAAYQWR